MPNVSIDIKELSGITPGTAHLKDAVVWFYPYTPYGSPIVTVDKLVVPTTLGVATTFLPQTPALNGMWVEIRNVRLPSASRKFVVAIPVSDCNLFDLPHLDPDSLDPLAPPSPAWVAQLAAEVARATAAEQTNATAIAAETTRATGVEATKVSTSTYTAGLALKQDAASLSTDTAPHVSDGTALDLAVTAKIAAGITGKANLSSPAFTGNPTAPTPTAGDNDTSIATTAFVTGALAASPGATDASVAALVPAPLTKAALDTRYGQGNILAPIVSAITTPTVGVVIGAVDGVTYGYDLAGTSALMKSVDDGANWTTVHTFTAAGAPCGIAKMGNGEVMVITPTGAYRSTGWAANPMTATWTLAATPTPTGGGFVAAAFIASTWDVYDNVVILGEYSNPKNNSHILQVSTNYGVTFATKFDLHTFYPGQDANTHYHSVCVDPWTVVTGGYRLWFTHGDGPRGVFYSDDNGGTWTQFAGGTGADMDLTASNAMTITATAAGMVLSTDSNAPDGIYKIARQAVASDMVIKRMLKIPYPYAAASLLGFGTRSWRDATGLVWITFSSLTPAAAGSPSVPGYVFVSDGYRATIAYTTPEVASTSNSVTTDGIAITASGALLMAYKYGAGPTYKQVKFAQPTRGGYSFGELDRGNALTGVSTSRESIGIGPQVIAKGDSVVIGAAALTTDTSGPIPQAVVIGSAANGGTQAVVIGNGASGAQTFAVVIGYLAAVSDIDTVAVGRASSAGTNSTVVGSGATAASNGVAFGKGALANPTGGSAVAIGQGATVGTTGSGAIAIGKSASATGANSVSVGGTASGTQTVAIGPFTTASTNTGATAIGTSATATGQYAVALGKSASATHNGSVALGDSSATTATQQIATGLRHFEMKEVTAPSAGGADTGRLYLQDNGAGKTQLCILFNTGAVQVIATQP